MLVYANGEQTGTLGGGCVEAEVKRNAIRVIQSGNPELSTFSLDHDYGWDDGLICGGRMTIQLEPLTSESRGYFQSLVDLADHCSTPHCHHNLDHRPHHLLLQVLLQE